MRHFISLLDHSTEEIRNLLNEAIRIKEEWRKSGNPPLLQGKTLGMLFMKPSLRTRVSFEMGMRQLGGHAIYLGPSEVGMGQRESIPDVARVLNGYLDGIMARVFEHEHIMQYAQHSSIPVINGLSDWNHPCQALADLLTITEEFGHYEGLKIAYVGDSNNVTRSLLFMSSKMGMHLNIASPPGYRLDENTLQTAQETAMDRTPFQLYNTVQDAVADVDVIYTDTWTSMGQEEQAKQRRKVFPPYQVNAALLEQASSHAIVLHCLPAHRGEEITDQVADGKQSRLFPQAHNRLHAQKALLLRMLGGDLS